MKTTTYVATFEKTLPAIGPTYWRLCMALLFACCVALAAVRPAWADDFEVTTELDGTDASLLDGECLNVTVVAGGACTLRAAIQQANASLEPDTIHLPPGTYILTIENPLDNAEDEAATGDLDITSNIVISGSGASVTIIEAADDLNDRVIQLIDEPAVVALNRLTVRNGNTTLLGGSRHGGGIMNGGGSLEGFELVVADSTSPTFGGGIYTQGVSTTYLHRCTINGNKAEGDSALGGGIWLGQNHSLTLANCTISDNEAGSRGGGLNVSNNSDLAIVLNTTIADNRLTDDPEQGGGIYIGNNTQVEVYSSLIANNTAAGGVANDCYGQFDILDFSLVEVLAPGNDCIVAGDGENISSFLGSDDPLLGPLADNGGELQTHALLEGSIAIDAGSQLTVGSGGRACFATDARGQNRPARAYCDMGSFELPESLFMPKLGK